MSDFQLTCKTCGHEFDILSVGYTDAPGGRRIDVRIEGKPCPVCSEPTYGPLTVEAVAEALFTSGSDPLDPSFHSLGTTLTDEYRQEARFVLRLLSTFPRPNHLRGVQKVWLYDDHGVDPLAWLLDLARQP